jgi:hypothetical protein
MYTQIREEIVERDSNYDVCFSLSLNTSVLIDFCQEKIRWNENRICLRVVIRFTLSSYDTYEDNR